MAAAIAAGSGILFALAAASAGYVQTWRNPVTVWENSVRVTPEDGYQHDMLADALQDAQIHADCVVVNMVLHHFAAPAEAFRQLANLLQSGGSLLVTELCSHNQAWAREACGDLWLGFEQDDLAHWATAAGLVPGESLYIGLRNGFQIQVRHFQRPAGDTHHR